MTAGLDVYLHDRLAGRLVRKDNGNLQYRYDVEYVSSGGPALSVAMPLQTEAFLHRTCLAVFGGVLPEQDVRSGVAALLGISRTNDFRLLEAIGGECAGAIRFGAPVQSRAEPSTRVRRLQPEQFHELVASLPERPLAVDGSGEVRLSLAGAQPKVPVIRDEAGWTLPLDGGPPSTHIIKPAPARFPDLVANESWCMQLAAVVGLDVAKVRPDVTGGGLHFLLVERYDRDPTVEPVQRLHQEDLCQALCCLPDEKYQAEGGPSAADAIELLRRVSAVPARDVAKFWDALVFSVLVGNCDAHGKNWSLLYHATRPMLAPCYDIVSTEPYPGLSTRLAMSIGSATQLSEVTLDNWSELAIRTGVNATYARTRVLTTARDAAIASRTLASSSPIGAAIAARVEQRARDWGATV